MGLALTGVRAGSREAEGDLMTTTDPQGDPEIPRHELARLFGGFRPACFKIVDRQRLASAHPGLRVERLTLSTPGTGPVRAFLSGPDRAWSGLPAVLYCHAHGNRYAIGASELIEGRPALLPEPYGLALAQRDVIALCIDMPCFGERATESESSLSKRLLWQGRTLFGQMLEELAGAFVLLRDMEGVDPTRIAAYGFSMGATHAFWLGAMEPRLAAVAHACCLADIAALIAAGAHDLHGHYMTVPGLLAVARTGQIAGLVAPRPQLAMIGQQDPLTPERAATIALEDLRRAYANAGAAPALTIHESAATSHVETPQMRELALAFLSQQGAP